MPSVERVVFKEGQNVLLLGSHSSSEKSIIEKVQCQVGSSGLVQLDLPEALATLSSSSYDVVKFVDPINLVQLDLDNLLRILRPSGVVIVTCLVLRSASGSSPAVDEARTSLKLNGFVEVKVESLAADDVQQVEGKHPVVLDANTFLCSAEAHKPSYEIGASMPLKLASKTDAVKAWTLNANDMFDDDIDVLDSDAVLDEVDLKKPDPATLKVAACTVDSSDATQTKRKACKNCTCGLAEELEGENEKEIKDTAAAKSACGSRITRFPWKCGRLPGEQRFAVPSGVNKCYLGDAFRCASCPYRGMPAFKPGEKVQLPALNMDDDI